MAQPLAPLAKRKFTTADFDAKLEENLARKRTASSPDDDWVTVENEDESDWKTVSEEPVAPVLAAGEAEDDRSLLTRGLDFATTPLSGDAFQRTGKNVGELLDDPNKEGFFKATGKGDLRDWLAWGEATTRGLNRGLMEGRGAASDSMTSPADLAATAMGAGAFGAAGRGMRTVAQALRKGTQLASLPVAGHGVKGVYEAGSDMFNEGVNSENIKGLALSGVEAIGGAAGMHFPQSTLDAAFPKPAAPRQKIKVTAGSTPVQPAVVPEVLPEVVPDTPLAPAVQTAGDSGARLDALYKKIDDNSASQAEIEEAANLLDAKIDAEQTAGIRPSSVESEVARLPDQPLTESPAPETKRASQRTGGFNLGTVKNFLKDEDGSIDFSKLFQGEEDMGYGVNTNDPDTISLGDLPRGEINLNQEAINAGSDLARQLMPAQKRPGFNQRALGTQLDETAGEIRLPNEFAAAENFNPESIPQTQRATRIPREGLPPEFAPDTRQVDEFMPEMGSAGYSPRFDELKSGQAFSPEQAKTPGMMERIRNFMSNESGEFDADAILGKDPNDPNQPKRSEFAYDWDDFHEDGMGERQYNVFGGDSHQSSLGAGELEARGYPRPETEPDFGTNVKQYPRAEIAAESPSFGQRFKESMSDEQGSVPRNSKELVKDNFGGFTSASRDLVINRKFDLPEGPVGEPARTGMRRVISAIKKQIGGEDYAALPDDEWRAKFAKIRTEGVVDEIESAIKYLRSQGDAGYPGQAEQSAKVIANLQKLASEAKQAQSTTFLERLRETLSDETGSVPRKDLTAEVPLAPPKFRGSNKRTKTPLQESIPEKPKVTPEGSAKESPNADSLFGRGDLDGLTKELVVMGRRSANDLEYQRLLPENLRFKLNDGETWRKRVSSLIKAKREGDAPNKIPMGVDSGESFDPNAFSAAKNDPQVVEAVDTIQQLEKVLRESQGVDPARTKALTAEIERQQTIISRVVNRVKSFMSDETGSIDFDMFKKKGAVRKRLEELYDKDQAGTLTAEDLAEGQKLTKHLNDPLARYNKHEDLFPEEATAYRKAENDQATQLRKEGYNVDMDGKATKPSLAETQADADLEKMVGGKRNMDKIKLDDIMSSIKNFMKDESGEINFDTPERPMRQPKRPNAPEPQLLDHSQLNKDLPIKERQVTPEEAPSKLRQAYDAPLSMMSIDAPYMTSAAFRQASPLAWTGNWFKAWKESAKAFGDAKTADTIDQAIRESKYFKPRFKPVMKTDPKTGQNTIKSYKEMPSYAEAAGVRMSDYKHITNREEAIRSQLAEKIPIYGKYVKASNRAYTTFLNSLRKSKFEQMMDQAEWSMGPNDLSKAKEIGEFINNATGRGSLKLDIGVHEFDFEKNAKGLAAALWSPRLLASRLKFLNPMTYASATPQVRKEYMLGLMRSLGNWWGMAGVASMVPGVTVGMDPTNADFGKIKIGDTRIDAGAGFQQLLVLGSRLGSGEFTSSVSGKTQRMGNGFNPRTERSTLEEFGASKMHPMAKLAYDLLGVTKNRPVHLNDRVLQMALPMMAQDIAEALKEDPDLAAAMVPLSSMGFGTSTYGKGSFSDPSFTDSIEEYLNLDPRSLAGTIKR